MAIKNDSSIDLELTKKLLTQTNENNWERKATNS
jgi:hypothetical protein